jgi:hypothetical protein
MRSHSIQSFQNSVQHLRLIHGAECISSLSLFISKCFVLLNECMGHILVIATSQFFGKYSRLFPCKSFVDIYILSHEKGMVGG